MLNEQEQRGLEEIHRLLDEAYKHYFEGGDGHCKSAEGQVEVAFGNYWQRRDAEPGESVVTNVSVYSYVLGPHRTHDFDTIAEALETVREWHADQMSVIYCPKCRYEISPECAEGRCQW